MYEDGSSVFITVHFLDADVPSLVRYIINVENMSIEMFITIMLLHSFSWTDGLMFIVK